MARYTLHLRAARPAGDPELIAVKDGFSWIAFLVPAIWAAWYGVWRGLVAYMLAATVLGVVAYLFDLTDLGQGLIGLGLSLLAGVEANDWRRAALARRGFREVAQVTARSAEAAETAYLGHHQFGRPTAVGLPL